MLLPDYAIQRYCDAETPLIAPFELDQLQPASYDLTLERQFCFIGANNVPFASNTYTLPSRGMILGCTRERIQMPPFLAGQVEGRSGNARRGIQVEAAGHVDPGYCGIITLEIVNLGDSPVILERKMGIAKIVFHLLMGSCEMPYSAERNRHQYSHSPAPR